MLKIAPRILLLVCQKVRVQHDSCYCSACLLITLCQLFRSPYLSHSPAYPPIPPTLGLLCQYSNHRFERNYPLFTLSPHYKRPFARPVRLKSTRIDWVYPIVPPYGQRQCSCLKHQSQSSNKALVSDKDSGVTNVLCAECYIFLTIMHMH